jgi:hypothetical protein
MAFLVDTLLEHGADFFQRSKILTVTLALFEAFVFFMM